MAQHSEKDYIVPTLLVLHDHEEGCPTEVVKEEITKYMIMTEEDMKPYASRNPNEPRYKQLLGNLISHANNELFQYIERVVTEELGKKAPKHLLILNEKGKDFVERLLDDVREEEAPEEDERKESQFDQYDRKTIEYAENADNCFASKRDQRLAKEVLEISEYKCQYALLANKKHQMFKGADGKPYAEAHHLIPLKASKDFFPRNLDRASNLVCLCPTCHAVLHHGSKDSKREILKVLYDNYIDVLRDDEGIFISFEKLLEKYY